MFGVEAACVSYLIVHVWLVYFSEGQAEPLPSSQHGPTSQLIVDEELKAL